MPFGLIVSEFAVVVDEAHPAVLAVCQLAQTLLKLERTCQLLCFCMAVSKCRLVDLGVTLQGEFLASSRTRRKQTDMLPAVRVELDFLALDEGFAFDLTQLRVVGLRDELLLDLPVREERLEFSFEVGAL